MTLVLKRPDPLQAVLKTGTLKIFSGAPGEEPEQIAEIDLSDAGPPIDITAQGYEVAAVWYESKVEQDPREMTRQFKITPADIGRTAISELIKVPLGPDAFSYQPIDWKIVRGLDDTFYAVATEWTEGVATALFDTNGNALKSTFGQSFKLAKWKNTQ